MSILSGFKSFLKPLTTEFVRLPKDRQDEILAKYRLPQIEFALACELEELQLLAADIDQASFDYAFIPLRELTASGKRAVPFLVEIKHWICAT
jgi:hypothetical protein